MKNLKTIIAASAVLAALGATSSAQAQGTGQGYQPAPAASQSYQPTKTPSHSRWKPNNTGCAGPVSFCNTYFGN